MQFSNDFQDLQLLRLEEVLKLIPVSKSSWWDGIKKGKYPKPLRIGSRSIAWRMEDIATCIRSFKETSHEDK